MDVKVFLPKVIKFPSADDFSAQLKNRHFVSVIRRGKYLLFQLSDEQLLVVHLRMTGRLLWLKEEEPFAKHTHLVFCFAKGYQLRFQDQRQFGTLHLVHYNQLHLIPGLVRLGPEPLADFILSSFKETLRKSKKKIKNVLLDQTIVAGIGNIYADEILFAAGIHPRRIATTLNADEVNKIYGAILSVLKAGICHRGTSFRDYVDGEGKQGDFQTLLKVYGREGLPCVHCNSLICCQKISGRSSCFCPVCQK
jgi:formamidopyrimidine-DNA glycosylase